MRQPEHALTLPARMSRVAVIAPAARIRDALAAVADCGTVEISGPLPAASGEALEALRRLERMRANGRTQAAVAPDMPDVAELERRGAVGLLAGEVELERRLAAAVDHGSFAALVGWTPQSELGLLRERLERVGATALELDPPRWLEPPTLIARKRVARPFRSLVETYGPARYADLDPTLFAAVSFVVMFGMMFADVGQGLLLAAVALAVRRVRRGRLAALRGAWALLFAAGLSAAFFGLLYGECFGPTGLVPVVWLDPVDHPTTLLAAAVAVGAAFLAVSYLIGTVNRWREAGPGEALLAPSGIAGSCIFVGAGVAAVGWYVDSTPVAIAGGAAAAAGLSLLALGHLLRAGRGPLAVFEVTVEVVDGVVRIGAGTISFTRLAAFGLMHAAVGAIVWRAAVACAGAGPAGVVAAGLVLLVGTAFAFSLELLVASIQALRLEYYELFSRIFAGEGQAFQPWHIPLVSRKEES